METVAFVVLEKIADPVFDGPKKFLKNFQKFGVLDFVAYGGIIKKSAKLNKCDLTSIKQFVEYGLKS